MISRMSENILNPPLRDRQNLCKVITGFFERYKVLADSQIGIATGLCRDLFKESLITIFNIILPKTLEILSVLSSA